MECVRLVTYHVSTFPQFEVTLRQAQTDLSPEDLLRVLQGIETKLGRTRTIANGPRSIDLDILLYDRQVIDIADAHGTSSTDETNKALYIPHRLMLERAFVLQPLCEYVLFHRVW